ncbi:Major facilitator superfamily domain general substrate transporter [Penicillium mononematosum]|uniref:Major facilitator superfamily domain general substrate transporter n=1 Tax=Penicillium mononematosum TaxID=268346 RepID=UPI00254935D4|nr:Major facilitator superfamily domain general substrate transporter [Penicillium mononematosum]KAJ6187601.1 Major facilitator superfamily domain general substrate transporter [Penicillium mononematosum]
MPGNKLLSETSRLLDEHVLENTEDQEEGQVNRVFLAVAMIGTYLAMADGSFVTATNEEIGKVFQRSDLGPWLISCYNFGYSVALPVGYIIVNANVDGSEILDRDRWLWAGRCYFNFA